MRHGKDVMVDKPAVITGPARRRHAPAAGDRAHLVGHFSSASSAGDDPRGGARAAGAIGRVVQTVGFGPHRLNRHLRPEWFFDPRQGGGILTDIGSHQIDQFLHFTGSDDAEIVASAVANYANPDQPEFEDFGEILLRSERGTGYIRVDWYTPDGLPTWGDGRCTILAPRATSSCGNTSISPVAMAPTTCSWVDPRGDALPRLQ